MPLRLVDLSSDGLLLACERPLTIAATSRVVFWLAGRRLKAELVVRHVSSGWVDEAGGYLVGGRIPALDPAARSTIDTLLASAGQLDARGQAAARAGRARSRSYEGDWVRGEAAARRPQRPRPKRVPRLVRPYGADSAHAEESAPRGAAGSPRQPG
jgi:hypothetical protein